MVPPHPPPPPFKWSSAQPLPLWHRHLKPQASGKVTAVYSGDDRCVGLSRGCGRPRAAAYGWVLFQCTATGHLLTNGGGTNGRY